MTAQDASDAAGQARVLLVEDTPALARTYRGFLRKEELHLDHVETGAAAKEHITATAYDLILLDLRLPDMSGLDILDWITASEIDSPVIVITAQGSVGIAVDAMRKGAVDFLMKPFAEERLLEAVRHHIGQSRFLKTERAASRVAEQSGEAAPIQRTERAAAPKPSAAGDTPDAAGADLPGTGFIGNSLPMRTVYRSIQSAAGSSATVFITGESGTGKEVCAEGIHKLSARNRKVFVPINCAAIPGELMESEIFGHVKGAFTGATSDKIGAAKLSDGGTLFLDEICEMPLQLQTKLLRFIQTGTFNPVGKAQTEKVDARFICATNRDPLEEVSAKRFREDLYYRLHVIPISMPPLRDRESDVVRLAEGMLAGYAREEGKAIDGMTDEARRVLIDYSWPGNVRQLQNVLRRAVVFGEGSELTAEILIEALGRAYHVPAAEPAAKPHRSEGFETSQDAGAAPDPEDLNALSRLITPLNEVERESIERAVSLCGGDVRKAAVFLGVSPATIYRKQKAWRGEE